MRAAVITAYSPADSVQVVQVAGPKPSAGQVLIAVQTTTVNVGDTEIRSMSLPWLFQLPIRLWLRVFKPRKGIRCAPAVPGGGSAFVLDSFLAMSCE